MGKGQLLFAARMLYRSPWTSLLAVVALALGIGLTTSMFSVVNGMLWSDLPFQDSERLVSLTSFEVEHGGRRVWVRPHEFLDWQQQQRSCVGLAAFAMQPITLGDEQSFTQRYAGAKVTHNTFALLGVQPLLGRWFTAEDDRPGAAPVVVLSHAIFRSRFASDRTILGSTIRVNGEPTTVVGVMPPGFVFPNREELWLPLRLDTTGLERGTGEFLLAFGRLRDGVSVAKAQAEFTAIAEQLAVTYPSSNASRRVTVELYRSALNSDTSVRVLSVLLIATGLVLLISCANVASLLLARASRRSRELAIRTSLGAGRRDVVSLMITESMFLSLPAAMLGLLLARIGLRMLGDAVNWQSFPSWMTFSTIDLRALLFVLSASLVTGVLAGLPPALRASQLATNDLLKGDVRGLSSLSMGRLHRLLVVAEITAACTLLVITGLTVRSAIKLNTVDLGFATDSILTANLTLPKERYPEEIDHIVFFDRLFAEMRTVPGVESIAVMTGLPGNGMGSASCFIEGKTYGSGGDVSYAASVSPQFFELFEIPLLEGRLFDHHDTLDSELVAVVNQSFARRSWPGQSPLGKRFRMRNADSSPWWTVVGVVPDGAVSSPFPSLGMSPAGFYLSHRQNAWSDDCVAVKTSMALSELTKALRAKVAQLDRNLAVYGERTMEQVVWEQWFESRLVAVLFAIFSIIAVTLTAVGIFGVVAFSVSQRTFEIGVRIALGAERRSVTALILRQGLLRLMIGLVLGLFLALPLGFAFRSFLFQVEPLDTVSFLLTALVLAAVALLANYLPALRAARIDPVVALRHE